MSAYAIGSGKQRFVFAEKINRCKGFPLWWQNVTRREYFMQKNENCEFYLNFRRNLLIFRRTYHYNTLCERI